MKLTELRATWAQVYKLISFPSWTKKKKKDFEEQHEFLETHKATLIPKNNF